MAFLNKRECKLCGIIIRDENFEEINDVVKQIFGVLLLKLTFDNDAQYVMCKPCQGKLRSALNFKSTCLYTDNTLISYFDFENPKPVDLKEIYEKEKGSKQGKCTGKREICRLCLKPMGSKRKAAIEEVPSEAIGMYIPEINFSATTDPAICRKCLEALCSHSAFLKACLDVEQNSLTIKTEEIDIKFEETEEADSIQEEKEECAPPVHYTSAWMDTEEAKNQYDSDDLKKTERADSIPESIKSEEGETISEVSNEEVEKEEGPPSVHSMNVLMDMEEADSRYDPDDPEETGSSAEPKSTSTKRKIRSMSRAQSASNESLQKRDSDIRVRKSSRKIKHRHTSEGHRFIRKDPSEEVRDFNRLRSTRKDKRQIITACKKNVMRGQLGHKSPLRVPKYECGECDYKGIKKGNLKLHRLIHKNTWEVWMYECDECDYKSFHKGTLKRHQLKHKKPSEVRMYECDVCQFETKYRLSLKTHRLRHKDPCDVRMYECDKCDYRSSRKDTLKSHQLRHKDPCDVRMYRCDVCDFKSVYKFYLKTHQLTHKDPSEVEVFECDECEFKTKYKSSLKKHVFKHKTR